MIGVDCMLRLILPKKLIMLWSMFVFLIYYVIFYIGQLKEITMDEENLHRNDRIAPNQMESANI